MVEAKHSSIYLETYTRHRRDPRQYDLTCSTFISHCIESPAQVFEAAFRSHYVTQFLGFNLYSARTAYVIPTPECGLAIKGLSIPGGNRGIEITGRMGEILESNDARWALLRNPLSEWELVKIKASLSSKRELLEKTPEIFGDQLQEHLNLLEIVGSAVDTV